MSFLHATEQIAENIAKFASIMTLHNSRRIQKVSKFLTALVFISASLAAQAQYHQVLPKGVRAIINKNISSEISATYNQSGGDSPIKYQVDANIDTLQTIELAEVQDILAVFDPYPQIKEMISLGNHQVSGKADVNVNVFAFGYGITDKMMAYVGVPVYEARVNMKYTRTKDSSQAEVAAALQEITNDNGEAQMLGAAIDKLYSVDESLIQSAFTNYLGYNEVGDWHGQGLGDIEFGLSYVLYKDDYQGLKLTLGGVAPTGYVDDPDTLQDIGFGNGQWDSFVEFGGGKVLNKSTSVDLWSRYTYQFASQKRKRIPISEGIGIGDESIDVNEKLGNKYLVGAAIKYNFSDWFSVKPSFTYEYVESADYTSDNSEADRLLEYNTDSSTQNLKLLATFSSVNLFLQKKFLLPGEISFSYQTVVGGHNTPKADLLELEFMMLF